MRKDTITALLTDLRALILKSRPAYRDYLGENVEHKASPILTDVVLPRGGDHFHPEDSTFSGFSAGETYHVTLNGKEFDAIASTTMGGTGISNVSASDAQSGIIPPDVWSISTSPKYPNRVDCFALGTFVGKTISVRFDKIIVESKWSVKKLAYELLPDRLFSELKEMMEKLNSQIKSLQVDPVFTGSFSQNRMPGTDIGFASHAEGNNTTASGFASHAEGNNTTASADYQHVEGVYNIDDGDKLHIVGNGTSLRCSNAHTLDKSGNAWYAGDVYVGSTSGINRDAGSKKLATEAYVDDTKLVIASPGGKKFKITVDDAGILSATEVTDTTT